jgi:hypothetical protein
MSAAPRLPAGLTPRLLGVDAAAAYLGVSAGHFERHVVPAIPAMLIGERRLWDIRRLDRWLDERSGVAHPGLSRDQWLGALDADPDEGRQARRR